MEMKSLGITGNIGTGKSSVLDILKNKGIQTFDLDNVAKNLYKSNISINKKVLDVFPSVSSAENQINTKRLGDLVFNNKDKLNILQKIIWPEVEKFIKDKIDFSQDLIVFEGAVIIEAGWHKLFDNIWLISTEVELSKKRVMEQRNMSEEDFEVIQNNQLKIAQLIDTLKQDKKKYTIIKNNSNLDKLKILVDKELSY
ncbi:MAG: dephospho-CoA kinase [Chloroflexota bacterium]|nr:dephospho-CoA kinase [Chloroflexota bacterium]